MSSILSTFLAALAVLSVVSASPIEAPQRKAFTLKQVERKTFIKNGALAKAKTLSKYGVRVPQNVLDAATARSDSVAFAQAGVNGTAPAVPIDEYDSLYLTPTQTGNSTVQLDFDTGSADLWVFSSLQASSQLTGHDYYAVDPAKEIKGATWRITYGDGSGAAGKVYADKVVVAGITATSQAVEAATAVSAAFQQDIDTDGLLGLSFSTLNTVRPTRQKTWFDNVKADLSEPLFAVALKYHAPGTYDFGFVDKSKYTGEITWIDIDSSEGFWQFTATGYSVGSDAVTNATIVSIGDTGTTLTYLPLSVLRAYYGKVPGSQNSARAGGWVFPCSSALPDFSLVLGGVKQTIPGKHLNYAPIQTGSSTCYGGLQDDSGIGFSILGDTFLKSKYVIHEAGEKPRLGIAQQRPLYG